MFTVEEVGFFWGGWRRKGARGVLCVYGECAMLGVCSIFLYI